MVSTLIVPHPSWHVRPVPTIHGGLTITGINIGRWSTHRQHTMTIMASGVMTTQEATVAIQRGHVKWSRFVRPMDMSGTTMTWRDRLSRIVETVTYYCYYSSYLTPLILLCIMFRHDSQTFLMLELLRIKGNFMMLISEIKIVFKMLFINPFFYFHFHNFWQTFMPNNNTYVLFVDSTQIGSETNKRATYQIIFVSVHNML